GSAPSGMVAGRGTSHPLSWRSTARPPTWPFTHLFGNACAQSGSASNSGTCGRLACAAACCSTSVTAITTTMRTAAPPNNHTLPRIDLSFSITMCGSSIVRKLYGSGAPRSNRRLVVSCSRYLLMLPEEILQHTFDRIWEEIRGANLYAGQPRNDASSNSVSRARHALQLATDSGSESLMLEAWRLLAYSLT